MNCRPACCLKRCRVASARTTICNAPTQRLLKTDEVINANGTRDMKSLMSISIHFQLCLKSCVKAPKLSEDPSHIFLHPMSPLPSTCIYKQNSPRSYGPFYHLIACCVRGKCHPDLFLLWQWAIMQTDGTDHRVLGRVDSITTAGAVPRGSHGWGIGCPWIGNGFVARNHTLAASITSVVVIVARDLLGPISL